VVGEGLHDVVGRGGALQRDPVVGVELLAAPGDQREVLGTQHGLDADRGLRAVAHEGVLDAEVDGDRAVLQAQVLDLTDLDAGDADRVVRAQARRLGELGRVHGAAPDERQRLRVERQQDERRDHTQADRADDDRVPVAEGLGMAGHQHPSAPLENPPAGIVSGSVCPGRTAAPDAEHR
jgi:hypothetical protein